MSDWISAQIWIGGPLKADLFPAFFEVVEKQSVSFDYDELPIDKAEELQERIDEINGQEPIHLVDNEARYGCFSDLEEFCRKHNLTYLRRTDPKYDDGYQVWWQPGMEKPASGHCTDEGHVLLRAEGVEKCLKEDSPEQQIERIKALITTNSPVAIPPLTLQKE